VDIRQVDMGTKRLDFAYWQARVMRHCSPNRRTEYAIHEVHFDRQHRPIAWTSAAVSPRFASPEALKVWIGEQLAAPDVGVVCGDSGYTHDHGDFEIWLRYVDEPPLEYAHEERRRVARPDRGRT
jgi:hypothetical protein